MSEDNGAANQHEQAFAQPYEPLTRRERDILALLAQDLSDREMADRLVVSLNTVKWYNRQIYGKLGVTNRREAAIHPLARSLLPSDRAAIPPNQNLPAQTTPFIGRDSELQKLTRLLRDPANRLVTLFATGGMGKTRLALAAAEASLPEFPDGVYFVSLASFVSADQIVPAIAAALGLQLNLGHQSPRHQVLYFLRDKHMLLVLDNCEQLADGAAVLTGLLEAAPRLHMLVTARERLDVSHETLYALGGMRYPPSLEVDNPLDYAAVQLFLDCGRRFAPQRVFDEFQSVIRICQLTQGMPLAIELAGAWLVALSPGEIAREIAQGIDFLQTTMRDLPERQRSIRAVFETSWHRLSDEEQRVFQRLSVFRGGFTREAAEAVGNARTGVILALVNKALISRQPDRDHYEIHELLRQFAEDRLRRSGLSDTARSDHAAYYVRFLKDRLPTLRSSDPRQALDEIGQDFDNIHEAVQYLLGFPLTDAFIPVGESLRLFFEARLRVSAAVHHPGLPYTSLRLYFDANAYFSADAAGLFSRALAKAHSVEAEISLREGLGDARQVSGEYDQARLDFEEVKKMLSREALVPRARILRKQALTLDAQDRLEDALQVLSQAEEMLKRSTIRDDYWWQEWIEVQNRIISAHFFLGHFQLILDCREHIRASVEHHGSPAQKFDFYVSLNALELAITRFTGMGNALEYARLGLAAAYETSGSVSIALGHIRAGITYLTDKDWSGSEAEFRSGLAYADQIGNVLTQTICAIFLAFGYRMRGQVEATESWSIRAFNIASGAGIELYLAAAKANFAWVAWRAHDFQHARSLALEAISRWQQVAPQYPLQWLAVWVALGVAVQEARLDDAVDYARQIMAQSQMMQREEAAVQLTEAIEMWDANHVSHCIARLADVCRVAGSLGYL